MQGDIGGGRRVGEESTVLARGERDGGWQGREGLEDEQDGRVAFDACARASALCGVLRAQKDTRHVVVGASLLGTPRRLVQRARYSCILYAIDRLIC